MIIITKKRFFVFFCFFVVVVVVVFENLHRRPILTNIPCPFRLARGMYWGNLQFYHGEEGFFEGEQERINVWVFCWEGGWRGFIKFFKIRVNEFVESLNQFLF